MGRTVALQGRVKVDHDVSAAGGGWRLAVAIPFDEISVASIGLIIKP